MNKKYVNCGCMLNFFSSEHYVTQNNLEITAVDSPLTNESDYHSTAKLKLGDPVGLPWEVLYLLLLELSPSWF